MITISPTDTADFDHVRLALGAPSLPDNVTSEYDVSNGSKFTHTCCYYFIRRRILFDKPLLYSCLFISLSLPLFLSLTYFLYISLFHQLLIWNNLVLYIDGPAYVHEYQTLLQSVTFDIMVDEPELTPRELCFTIFDGVHTSSPTCVVIEVMPVNDHAPELSLTSSNPLFVEQTTEGVVLFENIAITDVDQLDIFPIQHVSVSF